jgi:hypothetical protein
MKGFNPHFWGLEKPILQMNELLISQGLLGL